MMAENVRVGQPGIMLQHRVKRPPCMVGDRVRL
jgi:hypothetical protein